MITIYKANPTPKEIYHVFAQTIRYHRTEPLNLIAWYLKLLCCDYDKRYNIDKDYLYSAICIPALRNILYFTPINHRNN